jgi:hypothetical protein
MLTTFIVVAMFSAGSEIAMAHKMPRFRKLNANVWFNLLSSTLLSVVFSAPFGGGGVLITVTSGMSTAMTIPYYQFMYWWDHGTPEQKATAQAYIDDAKATMKSLGVILWVLWKILSAPAWVPRVVRAKKADVQDRLNNLRTHIPTMRGVHR